MIPGISHLNSVGSSPTLRKARAPPMAVSSSTGNFPGALSGSIDRHPMTETFYKKRKPVYCYCYSGASTQMNEEAIRGTEDMYKVYNPITNPLPSINQNPYMRKQR